MKTTISCLADGICVMLNEMKIVMAVAEAEGVMKTLFLALLTAYVSC